MLDFSNPNYEFLRPLVTGWVSKIESAYQARSGWQEVADECMMFYSKSAAAMWDQNYTKKFWKGVQAPKFRISMNKAFEYVAVFGPNLLWEVPHRNVAAKKPLDIPEHLFQGDQMAMQMVQAMQQQQQQIEAQDTMVAHLMKEWLNYTPRKQPGGGLIAHSESAVVDAMVKGRGCLWTRPYKFPSSGRTLTGNFREPPENLLIDPDFNSLDDAKWIALKHIDPHWSVERRFKLPANSLKERASLESSWSYGESKGSADGNMHRSAGMSNDLVVWYEIWSKTGCGSRMTGMETVVKEHLDKTVGDYAYLAIAPSVPYPLNCTTENLRSGLSDEQVKEKMSWPLPLWADDKWPVQCLDFYIQPDNAWPIPPLAPALGELKLLNFLIPWLANRIWSSSRDFWAVAGPHVEHYTKYLVEGVDQTIIPTPHNVDDVRKAVSVLQQPETRFDVWRIIEMVSELFDKRTGLTEFAYGRNEGGTQNRTAEETMAKSRAVGVRPEHMQKKVVEWQSQVAGTEAFVTRWFVTGQDVEPLLGPIGSKLWEQYIMSTDVELVVRQMQYTISSNSIRRPNRERDIANFQQVMQLFAPVMQDYGMQSGNFEPFNFLMTKWGELHDMDMRGMEIPELQPDPAQQQAEEQQQQMEMAKMQAELQGKQMDLQGKQMDIQGKQVDVQSKAQLAGLNLQSKQQLAGLNMQSKAQMSQLDLQSRMQQMGLDLQGKQALLGLDAAKQQSVMGFDAEAHDQEMVQDESQHLLDMLQDREKHRQEMEQAQEKGKVDIALARQRARSQPSSNGSRKPAAK